MAKKKLPGNISMFFRSLIFSIFVPLFTVVWGTLCLISIPLPLAFRMKLVGIWTDTVVGALKLICCIDYKVEGLESVPRDRTGIILCKHASTWETFYLPARFHQTTIILKRELLWMPFFGWGVAATSPIAINRSERSSAMAQLIEKGKRYLAAGRWILIFPEGTRIPHGKIGKYKLGGARLAVATGAPVIPVAHNAGRFWPKRSFMKKPGTITVVFGPMMESVDKTPEELMEKVQTWIESTIERIDGKKATPI